MLVVREFVISGSTTRGIDPLVQLENALSVKMLDSYCLIMNVYRGLKSIAFSFAAVVKWKLEGVRRPKLRHPGRTMFQIEWNEPRRRLD